MNKPVVIGLAVAAVFLSGCTARGTDPEFPMYVQCVEAPQ